MAGSGTRSLQVSGRNPLLLRIDGRGPYCWLVAAGQTHDDLTSICAAVPGDWQGALLSARGSSGPPGGPACHARADDLCSLLHADQRCALRRILGGMGRAVLVVTGAGCTAAY